MPMEKENRRLEQMHIPEDIIVQILYKLPVKSLIRFICVSKRWLSIISDPQFAKSHLKQASLKLLIVTQFPEVDSLELDTPSFGNNSQLITLPSQIKYWDGPMKPVGSCNGLVCLAIGIKTFRKKFYIWNPSTGFVKQLADQGPGGFGYNNYGFGYSSFSDDYKIFSETREDKCAEILSLKSNCWKTIKAPAFTHHERLDGILSNEALHWLQLHDIESSITAFDLEKEEVRKILLPRLTAHRVFQGVGVVLGGCLSGFSVSKDCRVEDIEIWVMKEYGVAKSWTKLIKFKIVYVAKSWGLCTWGLPLFKFDVMYYAESGRVVAKCERRVAGCESTEPEFLRHELVSYDLIKQDGVDDKVLAYRGQFSTKFISDIYLYHESLISVDVYDNDDGVQVLRS